MYFPPYLRYFLCIRLWNKVDEGSRVTWLCAPWTGTVRARRTRSSCSQASRSTVTSTCSAPTCAPWPPPWSWALGDTERAASNCSGSQASRWLPQRRRRGSPATGTLPSSPGVWSVTRSLAISSRTCWPQSTPTLPASLSWPGRQERPPSQLGRSLQLWLPARGTRAGQWPCGAGRGWRESAPEWGWWTHGRWSGTGETVCGVTTAQRAKAKSSRPPEFCLTYASLRNFFVLCVNKESTIKLKKK